MIVYLGLGANLGRPRDMLIRARTELAGLLDQSRSSSIYLTSPIDKSDQPLFYNQVMVGSTLLPPHALLDSVQKIETWLGRQKREHWGPREIDIDILLIDDLTVADSTLTLPHPLIQERDFVLAPLAELDPVGRHPILNISWRDLLARIPTSRRTIIKTIQQE